MKERVPALDGVRGAAIIGVLLYHFGAVEYAGKGRLLAMLGFGVSLTWVTVDLFFALSGFLITGILLDAVGKPNYFRNFYIRRALRIFPLYFAVILVLLAATGLLHLRWNGTIPYFLLYGQNYVFSRLNLAGDPPIHLMHLWTLAVEEQFYLVWPLVVLMAGTRARIRTILIATIVACAALRWIALGAGLWGDDIYFWTPFRVDALAWGALACVLQRELSAARMFNVARILVAGGAAGMVGIMVARGGFDFFDPVVQRWGYTLLGGFFCGLLVLIYQRRYGLDRIASVGVLQWFGVYSYGIYVFHGFTLNFLGGPRNWVVRTTHSAALGAVAQVVIGFAVSCAGAFLSYRYYETRWLRMKDRLTGRPRVRVVEANEEAQQPGLTEAT